MSDKIRVTVVDNFGNSIVMHGYLGGWFTLKQPIYGLFSKKTLVHKMLIEMDNE